MRLFLSPDLQAALQRAQQLIGILPRTLRLQTLQQFAASPPGLFVKLRLQFFGDGGRRDPVANGPVFASVWRARLGGFPPHSKPSAGPTGTGRETDRPSQPIACRTCRRCRRGAAAPSASCSATGQGAAAHMFARVRREPIPASADPPAIVGRASPGDDNACARGRRSCSFAARAGRSPRTAPPSHRAAPGLRRLQAPPAGEGLIILAVRPAARERDTDLLPIIAHHLVQEHAVIVGVEAEKVEQQQPPQFRQHLAQQLLLADQHVYADRSSTSGGRRRAM